MKHHTTTTTFGRAIVTTLSLASAAAMTAFGQEPTTSAVDSMAAFKTDQGLISLTKAAPEMTPVSDYTGDFWKRATLIGGPADARTHLYDQGITLDAQLTQVYQGVTSGGSVKGKGEGEYNGLFEANLTLDTAKAGLWSGGVFIFTGQSGWGDPLQKQAGNLSPINATALWPISYEDSTELMEYQLIQALPFNTVVIVGRIDPTNYLDQNSFACNSDSQFLNVSMNSDPLFGRFLTYSTYAALFMTKVSDEFTLAYGAWTPNTQPGDYLGDWDDFGTAIYPQYKYKAFGLPGAISAILAYTSKDATDVDNPRLLQGQQSGDLPTKDDNWIVEFTGEQYFWEPVGASVPRAEGGRKENFHVPTKDFTVDRPGLGIFYRFSATPEDRSAYDIYLSGGVGGRGVIPGRPHDRFGVGSYWLRKSDTLDKQPGNLLGDEVGMEAFYNIAITPYVQLTLDAQYISQAIISSDEAVVLGTRLNLRF